MNKLVSKLLIYGDMPKDSILMELSAICQEAESSDFHKEELINRVLSPICEAAESSVFHKEELISRIYRQIKRILVVATEYGFNRNLWHNYLTFLLIMDENPFSITCEKTGAKTGSVNHFAKNDFKIFMQLFHYDFSALEKKLGIDCFSCITNYEAIEKPELMYNKNVSEKVQHLSKELESAADEEAFFLCITTFYKDYGVGAFGLNKAFRIQAVQNNQILFQAINNMDKVVLDDLIGYEIQKKKLVDNTKAFVDGKKANNVLLFGDSGTGKSTSIKAIVNEFYKDGLRMIEIYKHQFKHLSQVIAQIKNRNYKFIIYMDDLSFEDFETEYKFLKAVIEGGVETKPQNILIYATSNRRHLIRETWKDRNDMDTENGMHHSDTMEEKLSLAYRFGVTINYSKPSQKEYFHIVTELARKNHITLSEEEICKEANKWELSHGGISGRTAQQFINYLAGMN